ncbi:MAG: thiol:disulfide interchange protein DsbA/DsbL [Hydrogenophilus sp.]|nr:thiol:disulfide interchange protein DsbA/DsbL [Hydrogenophilus sp.]
MNRRALLAFLTALPFTPSLPAALPYDEITPPLPTPSEFIEVIEFFHYGCPHCRDFDPLVTLWAAQLPSDVRFRATPVLWNQRSLTALATLYYALEVIGEKTRLHSKIFAALQIEKIPLYDRDAARLWLKEQGVDDAAFVAAWDSLAVQTKVKQADREARAHKIDSVPTLVIAGRYRTSAALAGGHDAVLKVADQLIARVRRERSSS